MTLDSRLHTSILKIAVPSILANITIPLVGLVDMVIAGHLASAWAIGGIAVGTMLFDMLYGCFGFLRVSTAGLTAQAYGAGQPQECGRLLFKSSWIALAGAMVIWLLQTVYLNAVLYLMPCSDEVAQFARAYFNIRVWAAPATLMIMTCKGWFIGMQDGVRAMVVDLVVNGVNMLASYMLAVHTPLGVNGVAWGTLIAQWTGLIVALAMIALRYNPNLQFPFSNFQWFDKRFVKLNADLFVRSLCFIVVYVGWTVISSSHGDVELAASSLMMKLFMFFSYFIDGFAYSGEALVGKSIGSRLSALNSQLSTIIRALFAWGTGVALVFSLFYGLFPNALFRSMTTDLDVVHTMRHYLGWLILMPLVSMLAFMWDGIFAGATQGKAIRNAMLWAAAAFALVYILLSALNSQLSSTIGMHAVYAAYFAHLLARVIYLTCKYPALRSSIGDLQQ